ncbi:hypothetical protein MA16_Dca015999 [Dendrobium catenatum]|uniref:Protein NUCLEAR FUSION DEFECTIVE 6, chloroplastic/mitochondrial n=1 Tax=Dendrobium catenatum TaxID=906689 RepID=A0A2I0VV40_9ASPA|nr:hypothetical protein MA16_Dca015999 [Dendrobium catenatum]
MSSICRSVAVGARFISARSKTVLPKTSPSRRAAIEASRFWRPFFLFYRPLTLALGCVESLRPLHSATASARLISNIAVHSCWSWVSQGEIVYAIFSKI